MSAGQWAWRTITGAIAASWRIILGGAGRIVRVVGQWVIPLNADNSDGYRVKRLVQPCEGDTARHRGAATTGTPSG